MGPKSAFNSSGLGSEAPMQVLIMHYAQGVSVRGGDEKQDPHVTAQLEPVILLLLLPIHTLQSNYIEEAHTMYTFSLFFHVFCPESTAAITSRKSCVLGNFVCENWGA